MAHLREVARTESNARSSHRVMSWAEVIALLEDGLFEPGAHTIGHLMLASLERDEQRYEIRHGKATLESKLGRPVTSFAYPFGRPEDFTSETVDDVHDAGFAAACVNFEGTIVRSSDPLQLPRLFVKDWDGERFGRWLSYWLDR